MRSRRRSRVYISISLVLACLCVGPLMAGAALELHWDRPGGTSFVVLLDADGNELAQYPWNGALPLAYISEEEEIEIPILLPAALRDQLTGLNSLEATNARQFLEGLMGAYSETPTAQIPPSLRQGVGYAEYGIEEWCGVAIDAAGICLEDDGDANGGPFCKNAVCKGTRINAP